MLFLTYWLSFGKGGGDTFEIGRPRSGWWKNLGRRWTRGWGGGRVRGPEN